MAAQATGFFADQTSTKQQFGLPSVGKERLRGAAARRQNPPRPLVAGAAVHPVLRANPGVVLLGEIVLHLFSIVVAEIAALLLPEAVLSYSAGSFFQAAIISAAPRVASQRYNAPQPWR